MVISTLAVMPESLIKISSMGTTSWLFIVVDYRPRVVWLDCGKLP
jgi:hypothetical protein